MVGSYKLQDRWGWQWANFRTTIKTTVQPVEGAGADSNDGHKRPRYLQACPNLAAVLPTGQQYLVVAQPGNTVIRLPSLLLTEYKGSRQAEGLDFQLLPQ
jgi:hypothetical protein